MIEGLDFCRLLHGCKVILIPKSKFIYRCPVYFSFRSQQFNIIRCRF